MYNRRNGNVMGLVKEAGHIAMMDQPDQFCNALTKSLQELNSTVT